MNKKLYFHLCIKEAIKAIKNKEGGPFGAIIIKDNKIISKAHNTVLKTHDPSAHAEVNAIRKASNKLKNENLKNAILFTNVEPCPMCLATAYWANIKEIYYITPHNELKKISNFQDDFIYKEFKKSKNKRKIPCIKYSVLDKENKKLFKIWKDTGLHY